MNKTGYFKVAGHTFSLSLPDSKVLWDALQEQYEPFRTEAAEGELLFSLEYTQEPIEGQRICVYDEPTQDGETVVKLYRCGTDWIIDVAMDHRMPICATIRCNEDFSKGKLYLYDRKVNTGVFGINNGAMLMYAFAGARYKTLEMHASVIEKNGKAYLFLGKSGTGKSTHSSLWLKHIEGTTLMNDDNPIIRIEKNGEVMCYGSPWSGKTRCYKNISAPAGAFVQIRQCPENKIQKLAVLQAYSILFSSVSGLKDDDSSMADFINDSMSDVIGAVPFYLLDCRIDPEAAHLCARTVGAE